MGAFALLAALGTNVTDYVERLPDFLEVPAYALVPAVAAWVAGYLKRHAPDALSASAVDALRARVRGKF